MGENIISNKKRRANARKVAKAAGSRATKPLKSTLLVICEGNTEKIYMNSLLKEFYSNKVNLKSSVIDTAPGTDPVTVVEHALNRYHESCAYDLVVCVFDRDSYHLINKYQEALQKCRDISLPPRKSPTNKSLKYRPKLFALTNVPCFELWFLLTYKSTTKHYVATERKSPADCLISELENCWPHGGYNKTSTENFYLLGHQDKGFLIGNNMKRALELDKHCAETQTDEPSTTMHKFIDVLENEDIIPIK